MLGAEMERFAQALKRDPQLDSVLRQRGPELGIAEGSRLALVVQSQKLDYALTRELGLRHGPASAWACEPRRWTTQTDTGSAERAFEALRAEVAALRQAVEGQTAPDYALTLGAIVKELQGVGARLTAIEGHPALAMTPEGYSAQLTAAAERAYQAGGKAAWGAQTQIDDAARRLERLAGKIHTRDEQHRWIGAALALGVMLGIALW